jgi:hypothetical protein
MNTLNEIDAMIARQSERLAQKKTQEPPCRHDWGKWRSNGQRICLTCREVEYDALKDQLGAGDRGSREPR